ncbi:hypothetical protein [Streptomyces sp. NPDC048481]|uniref:hypothetical protein n=1 Tax=Streptomyces sp. NPDC048481 TaxID=3365557 RepID=UPI0037125FFE
MLDVPPESAPLAIARVSNGLSENERSSELRDPWGEPPAGTDAGDGAADEVTVQLDPLQQGRADGSDAASDVPVFVDESGRRSRTFRRIGILVGTACGAYAVVIVAALLSGNAGAPWLPLPVPGQGDDKPAAGKVDSTPAPDGSGTARPGVPGPGVPGGTGATASATGAAPGKPGASAGPAASVSAAPTAGASAAARPAASGPARPSAGPTASASAAPGPSSPVIAPTPSAPPPASSPAASPPAESSPSPAGGASTTVAGGPQEPAPAASSPAA